MKRVAWMAAIAVGYGLTSCAQSHGSATDRTSERLATIQMIQETWDKKFGPALADELADTPGGPVLAAMRAGCRRVGVSNWG
jgi:hypothetical protein